MKKKKLAVIGTVGVPAKYGGFETLAHHLVLHLNQEYDMLVYASKKEYEESERLTQWNGARIQYVPLKANGFQSIFYDAYSIIHALIYCDVLLVLGVSGCFLLPFIQLFSKKKIIVNIDGLEWRRPKWNRFAKAFLRFSESLACRFADEIVTDNQMLKEYVKIQYGIKSKLIEYGADHCKPVAIQENDLERYAFLAQDYAFKVARIEPENHIQMILEAFAYEEAEQIVMVGNWNNSAYGRDLKQHYQHFPNIHLFDPIYDPRELNLLRSNAHYYIHGHSAGGTNPSLVEAMYLGLPILSFDVIYNRATTNNQAIYFNNVEELRTLLQQVNRLPLKAVSENLQDFAFKKYLWKDIAQRYSQLAEGKAYQRILLPQLVPVRMHLSKAPKQLNAAVSINNNSSSTISEPIIASN
ncbi:MAG: DUF1972 domain-containing protein [Bacteroidota bacterium]